MNDEAQSESMAFAIGQVGAPDLYPIQSCIASTAEAAKDAEDRTALILDDHLKSLCALQLRHLERVADNEYALMTGFDPDEQVTPWKCHATTRRPLIGLRKSWSQ